MSASLSYLSLLNHYDLISIPDGTESMRNDYDGLLTCLDQLIKSHLHLMLTLSIQSYNDIQLEY